MVHDRCRGWDHLDLFLMDIRRNDHIAEIFLLQGKKLLHLRLHLHAVYHLRINDPHLIQTSFQIILDQGRGDQTGSVHGRVLHRVVELFFYRHMSCSKILSSQLSHDIQTVFITFFHPFMGKFQYIVVISTCQTLITCNDYQATDTVLFFDLFSGVKIRMLCIPHMAQDTPDQALKGVKIRFCIFQKLFAFLQLG